MNETKTITIGGRYLFLYPNYGTPDSHPDYTAHSGQAVTVESQLTDKECDPECGPAFWVKAGDGWRGNAHVSELEELKIGLRIWGNYVIQSRQSVGGAARHNRRSYSGTAIHRITIEEIVRVIDEEKELDSKGATLGKRFLMTGKPTEFSSYPNCGCCQGQHAAREVEGATVTCKKCGG